MRVQVVYQYYHTTMNFFSTHLAVGGRAHEAPLGEAAAEVLVCLVKAWGHAYIAAKPTVEGQPRWDRHHPGDLLDRRHLREWRTYATGLSFSSLDVFTIGMWYITATVLCVKSRILEAPLRDGQISGNFCTLYRYARSLAHRFDGSFTCIFFWH
jgi:hypothetical protein